MIMMIKSVDECEVQFTSIFLCTRKEPVEILQELSTLNVGELIHDYGDLATDDSDPFKFSQIMFN